MAINILNELLAEKLGVKKKQREEALKLFEEKEKIKSKQSETRGAIQDTQELLKSLGIGGASEEVASEMGTAKPESTKIDVDQDLLKTAIARGAIKRATGIEIPETQTERESAIRRKVEEKEALQKVSEKAMTAEQKNNYSNVNNQILNMDIMEKLIEDTAQGPIEGRKADVLSKITGGIQNPSNKQYNDFANAMSAGLYRALTSDTRLSDADAASRARPLLPYLSDAKGFNSNKFKIIKDMLKIKQKMVKRGVTGEISLEALNQMSKNENIDEDLSDKIESLLDSLMDSK